MCVCVLNSVPRLKDTEGQYIDQIAQNALFPAQTMYDIKIFYHVAVVLANGCYSFLKKIINFTSYNITSEVRSRPVNTVSGVLLNRQYKQYKAI